MIQLRRFRIFLATLFLAASAAFLFCGRAFCPPAEVSEKSQIILSQITLTIGATFVWLLLSFLFGRIYCSMVCPVGIITQCASAIGRKCSKKNPRQYSWRNRSRLSKHFLWIYILSLLIGINAIPFFIEPWNVLRSAAAIARPETIADTWNSLGISTAIGAAIGIISILALILWAAIDGRSFCTDVCPIGSALGLITGNTLYHIEIDRDKCSSCGKCEEICPAHCIKVSERLVDNARCLRCFNCTAHCPDEAIHFQNFRNTPLDPLFQKKTEIENS